METFVGTKYGFWVGENHKVGSLFLFKGSHSSWLWFKSQESPWVLRPQSVDPSRVLFSPCARLAPREKSVVPRGV